MSLADPPRVDDPRAHGDGPHVRTRRAHGPDTHGGPVALAWLDAASLTAVPLPAGLDPMPTSAPPAPSLLPDRRRRLRNPAAVLAPLAVVLVLAVVYSTAMLLWPTSALPPHVSAAAVHAQPAAVAAMAWPQAGSAGVAVDGFGPGAASTGTPSSIASITKVVTALVILDRMPLKAGEDGPSFRFTSADRSAYRGYLRRNESALDVPAGGSLTQRQLLEGMLIGSASNYAAYLADQLWPNDRVFADAANQWLQAHGVTGITIADPTGFDRANTATPAALIEVARLALANPVIAAIVAEKSVDLPGAGKVDNTNELLADPGVIGLKTGTLEGFDLLAAKDVRVDGTSVRITATVLNQPDDDTRWSATRALFTQVEAQLQPHPSVVAGTRAGTVSTAWGERVPVTVRSDAAVVLWNGAAAQAATRFRLGDGDLHKGDVVGALTVTGPLNTATADLVLARDVAGPSPWWRLTHPLALLGVR